MGKTLGSEKTGGRQKGTPNKKTTEFSAVLDAHGLHLLDDLLNEIGQLKGAEKVKAMTNLLPYLYPKRKALEAGASSLSQALDQSSRHELEELKYSIERRLGYPDYRNMTLEEKQRRLERLQKINERGTREHKAFALKDQTKA